MIKFFKKQQEIKPDFNPHRSKEELAADLVTDLEFPPKCRPWEDGISIDLLDYLINRYENLHEENFCKIKEACQRAIDHEKYKPEMGIGWIIRALEFVPVLAGREECKNLLAMAKERKGKM